MVKFRDYFKLDQMRLEMYVGYLAFYCGCCRIMRPAS